MTTKRCTIAIASFLACVLAFAGCGNAVESAGSASASTEQDPTVTVVPVDEVAEQPTAVPALTPPPTPTPVLEECVMREFGAELLVSQPEADGVYTVELDLVGLGLPAGSFTSINTDGETHNIAKINGNASPAEPTDKLKVLSVDGLTIRVQLLGNGPAQLGALVNAEQELKDLRPDGTCNKFYSFTNVTADPVTIGV